MTLAKAVVTGTVYRKPQTGYSTNDVAISSFTIDIGEKEALFPMRLLQTEDTNPGL